MGITPRGAGTSELACEVCGRLPHPHKLRLTLAKLASVLPIELLLHAVVIYFHMSYLLTVTVLTITTTVLVIWFVEPSALRLPEPAGSPQIAEAARITQAYEQAPSTGGSPPAP